MQQSVIPTILSIPAVFIASFTVHPVLITDYLIEESVMCKHCGIKRHLKRAAVACRRNRISRRVKQMRDEGRARIGGKRDILGGCATMSD